MFTDRLLLLLTLAVGVAVVAWFWPWDPADTVVPFLGITGFALKSWSAFIYPVFIILIIIILLRKTLFR